MIDNQKRRKASSLRRFFIHYAKVETVRID